ncbi:MAG: HNH endonuclease [Geobacteraceae bacterium]|nr:HNH endonuclease [Geobacteraceae bacterium]
MSRNYDGSSDNYYGKGRSKGNRNDGYSSRKTRSVSGESKPELETRIHNGYKQFRDSKTGDWVYTYRRVMEKQLGGDIFPGHEVQHKNHNKRDNRPENLVVLSKRYHRELHSVDREQEALGDKFDNCWSWSKSRHIMNKLENPEDRPDHLESKHRHNRQGRY